MHIPPASCSIPAPLQSKEFIVGDENPFTIFFPSNQFDLKLAQFVRRVNDLRRKGVNTFAFSTGVKPCLNRKPARPKMLPKRNHAICFQTPPPHGVYSEAITAWFSESVITRGHSSITGEANNLTNPSKSIAEEFVSAHTLCFLTWRKYVKLREDGISDRGYVCSL